MINRNSKKHLLLCKNRFSYLYSLCKITTDLKLYNICSDEMSDLIKEVNAVEQLINRKTGSETCIKK